jgi:tRNA-splicing ligase RtcB (3'-phosphate/5'-hydroxy nucleic acid ligase)
MQSASCATFRPVRAQIVRGFVQHHDEMTTHREIDGIAVFGQHEESTLQQMRAVSRHTAASALMADAHHGYVMPVGGVAAYREQV